MFEGKRILLVDDDNDYRSEVSSFLASRGFSVYPRATKDQFIESLNKDSPDLVLVDKIIGNEDGFDLIHEVRQHPTLGSLPIIVITGVPSFENKKNAILMGADDLLSKPLSLMDLELHIVSNLRRSKCYQVNDRLLKFGDIEVDLRSHRVTLSGRIIDLTRTEYKILLELLSKREKVVNRDLLAQRFLSFRNSNARTLDVHINALRKKLGAYSSCLKTIRGRGYMFIESKNATADSLSEKVI